MGWLINKIRLLFKPKLIKVIPLPTGVVIKHYQHWNRVAIVVCDINAYEYHGDEDFETEEFTLDQKEKYGI